MGKKKKKSTFKKCNLMSVDGDLGPVDDPIHGLTNLHDNLDDDLDFLDARIHDNLDTFPLLMMSVNVFFADDNNCAPAEFGISHFTLKDGLVDKFHCFFHPESIPHHELANVKEFSENYHKIPFDSNFLSTPEQNYEFIDEMYKFTHIFSFRSFKLAYLFCHDDHYNQVCLALDWCQQKSLGRGLDWNIKVLPLSHLYHYYCDKLNIVATDTECEEAFNSTNFYFYDLCNFHNNLKNRLCSLSIALGYSYIMAEKFCPKLKLEMTAGRHYPKEY